MIQLLGVASVIDGLLKTAGGFVGGYVWGALLDPLVKRRWKRSDEARVLRRLIEDTRRPIAQISNICDRRTGLLGLGPEHLRPALSLLAEHAEGFAAKKRDLRALRSDKTEDAVTRLFEDLGRFHAELEKFAKPYYREDPQPGLVRGDTHWQQGDIFHSKANALLSRIDSAVRDLGSLENIFNSPRTG